MMISDRLLFLDYDGCLHRGCAVISPSGVISDAPGIVDLFEYAPVLERLLAPWPRVQIVLSTDWACRFGPEKAREALPSLALRNRVIDSTYDSAIAVDSWLKMSRGLQIATWLERNDLEHARWLALDDRIDGFTNYWPHLVKCQEAAGLGDLAVQQMLVKKLTELHE